MTTNMHTTKAPQSDAPNTRVPTEPGRKLRSRHDPAETASERADPPRVQTRPPARPDAPPQRRLTVGTKLTAAQRQIVLHLLAEYTHIPMVVLVLRRDYPEVPLMTERTLRSYRAQRRQVIAALVPPSDREALDSGFARRAQRIRHLTYQYERLLTYQVRMDEQVLDAGRVINPHLALVGQLRALLDQIANEAGDCIGVARVSPMSPPDRGDTQADPARQAVLAAKLDRLLDERAAMREAERLSLPVFLLGTEANA